MRIFCHYIIFILLRLSSILSHFIYKCRSIIIVLSTDSDLPANSEIANSIIGRNSDYEVPKETLMNIDFENWLCSTEKQPRRTNVLKSCRFNVTSDEDVQNILTKTDTQNTISNSIFAVKTFQFWSDFRIQQKETMGDPIGKYILINALMIWILFKMQIIILMRDGKVYLDYSSQFIFLAYVFTGVWFM